MRKHKSLFHLEEKLARMHNRKYCIVVSRCSTAIYLALKALGFKSGKVVLPSILCLNPANAVIYAGLQPVFCDVNLTDFNLDTSDLERVLSQEKDVRAVILPHLYGQPTKIERVERIVRQYGVRLIEDVAQALGGEYQGSPLGSFGDFSVLSFGHTKIIDVGGGGAILFNNKRYFESIKKELRALPNKAKTYAALRQQYRTAYYTLAPLVKADSNLAKLYYGFPYVFKDLYLFKDVSLQLIKKISKGLMALPKIIKRRNQNAAYYKKYLRHKNIVHPRYVGGGVYWRYSFMVRGSWQQEIADEIRARKIDVSNWYPPVHLYYEIKPRKLKNAEYLGGHIFNLWVDPRLSKKEIQKNAEVVLEVLDKYERKK